MDELLTDDFEFTIPTLPTLAGRDALRGHIAYLRSAFTDLKFSVVRETAGDNMVALRWRLTGTHTGEFNGVPASGNAVDEYGIDMFEFWNGKIRTVHVVANLLRLARGNQRALINAVGELSQDGGLAAEQQ